MKTSINEALILTIAMAATIFFCRLFPFLFFRSKKNTLAANAETPHNVPHSPPPTPNSPLLSFIEKTVPPVAMTVLAFNALSGTVQASSRELISALAAAVFTAIVHVWKRNPLISIFGGTALFVILSRVL